MDGGGQGGGKGGGRGRAEEKYQTEREGWRGETEISWPNGRCLVFTIILELLLMLVVGGAGDGGGAQARCRRARAHTQREATADRLIIINGVLCQCMWATCQLLVLHPWSGQGLLLFQMAHLADNAVKIKQSEVNSASCFQSGSAATEPRDRFSSMNTTTVHFTAISVSSITFMSFSLVNTWWFSLPPLLLRTVVLQFTWFPPSNIP